MAHKGFASLVLAICVLGGAAQVTGGRDVALALADEKHSQPLSTKIVVLNADRSSITFGGITIAVHSENRNSARSEVQIECYSIDATPELALDRSRHPAGAHLINLTRTKDS